jgi:hypothetical protein
MGRSEAENGRIRGSRTPGPNPVTSRSGVTNGSRLMLRLRAGNRFYLDLGGNDNCSEAEKSLIRRAATLTLQCELMEEYWVAHDDGKASEKSLICYQRAASALRRILESLGLQRRAKDVTPTLQEYLRTKYDEADDVAATE